MTHPRRPGTDEALPFSEEAGNLIGPGEAARKMGVRVQTLWRWMRAGRIPSVELPDGRRLYSEVWIDAYLASHGEEEQG